MDFSPQTTSSAVKEPPLSYHKNAGNRQPEKSQSDWAPSRRGNKE